MSSKATNELLGSDDNKSFEHVIEAFYNIELLPWVHLTVDLRVILNPLGAQIINTTDSVKDEDLAIVLGGRLQIDF